MPDIKIVKLKARRGTNDQRLNVVLDEGEIGYTTDGKRLFVGDGATPGGITQTFKIHQPGTLFENTNGFTGDILYCSNFLWQLTGSNPSLSASWAYIGPHIDNTTIQFNSAGELYVSNNGITLDPDGSLYSAVTGIGVKTDGVTIDISANALEVMDGGITVDKLSDDMFASESNTTPIAKGSDGNTITLKYNTSNFEIVNNNLSLLGSGARTNITTLMKGSLAYAAMYVDSSGRLLTYGTDQFSTGSLGIGTTDVSITQTAAEPVFVSGTKSKKIVDIVGAYSTAFAIADDGYVYVTGKAPVGYVSANYGSVFQVLRASTSTPLTGISKIVVSPISNLTYLSASFFAIDTDNALIYSWGYNSQYQLGLGHATYVTAPTLITNLTGKNINNIVCMCGINSTALDVVSGTTFAMSTTGVYAVGANNYGQAGIGQSINTAYVTNFTLIGATTAEQIKQVACSSDAAFFVSTLGTVSAVGRNPWGQEYSSTSNIHLTALSAVPGLSNVRKLTVSQTPLSGSRIAITNDNYMYVWGNNSYGQLGIPWSFGFVSTPSFALTGVADIFTGGYSISATTSFYINTNGVLYGSGFSGPSGPGGFGYTGNTWQYTFVEVPLPKIAMFSTSIIDVQFKYLGYTVNAVTPMYATEILLDTGEVLNAGLTLSRGTSAYMLVFNTIKF